jgi:hypothetical protein
LYVARRRLYLMPEDWSITERNVIVADYFQMLIQEIAGQSYNKTEHRRAILPLLNNRSPASVEFKHQNISAVLARLGLPYINGYKPAWNYQKVLDETVIDFLKQNLQLENSFKLFALTSLPAPQRSPSFESLLEAAPHHHPMVQDPEITSRSPVKVNYLEIEQANKLIGISGEKIALEYERWRLINLGKASLADHIEWVSQTQGDGVGFDILSRNENGTDRFIEVKTTKLTKEAPIFFSKNEFDFSASNKSNYYLYRVFNLRDNPRLFIVNGSFNEFCNYQPVKFKGFF